MEPHADNGGISGAARALAEHASAIARLELELAAAELKRKLVTLGLGAALIGAALLVGFLATAFAFAAAAAAIAVALPWWLSLLILTGALGALAIVLGVVGVLLLKRGTPPVPEQTIEEARLTRAAIRR